MIEDEIGPETVEVYAGRLLVSANALARFAQAYLDTDPLDTSVEERGRLRQADATVQEALDLFS
jgi:hypothetical protein